MGSFVGRSFNSNKARFFPPISPSLYSRDKPDNTVKESLAHDSQSQVKDTAKPILALADQIFTRWQLWTGRGLDSVGQLGRLLWLHRAMFDNELNGYWKRADFYWHEILRSLNRMDKQTDTWQELSKHFNYTEITNNSDSLRDRIISELLIDVYCAFFNGYLKQPEAIKPGDRAVIYANRILELISLCCIYEQERWFLAEPVADILLDTYQSHKQKQKVCEDMSHNFPDRWKYQDLLVDFETENIFTKLHDAEDKNTNLKDARHLQDTINSLENLRKTYPNNPRIYDAIGLLNQVRAVKLVNGGKLSQSLLAIETSLIYAPGSFQTIELREQLYSSMNTLSTQIAELEDEISRTPNATLNAEGIRLKNEVNNGWKSVDEFIKSSQAAEIITSELQAQAVRLWQLAGLGGHDQKIASNAMKLYDAISPLFSEIPEDPEALKSRLIELTVEVPEVDDSMRKSLEEYLAGYFFDSEEIKNDKVVENKQKPQLILPHSDNEVASSEPAGMWLFSKESYGIKLVATSVLLVMVISGGMASWEWYQRSQRDIAFSELREAISSNDEQYKLQITKKFLSASGFKTDSRHKQVEKLHNQLMELPNQRIRDTAYTNLKAALKSDDFELILDAGETFLMAPPIYLVDERNKEVKEAYSQAFVSWFISIIDPNDTSVQKRIKTYTELTNVTGIGG